MQNFIVLNVLKNQACQHNVACTVFILTIYGRGEKFLRVMKESFFLIFLLQLEADIKRSSLLNIHENWYLKFDRVVNILKKSLHLGL